MGGQGQTAARRIAAVEAVDERDSAGSIRFFSRFGDRRAKSRSVGGASQDSEALLLLRNFEESCLGWFWATDAEGRLTYLSDSVTTLIGRPAGFFQGADFAEVFTRAEEDETGRGALSFMLARHSAFDKLILRAASGIAQQIWSVSGRPQFDPTGNFTGFCGSALDVTEQRRSSEYASKLAKYDPLTGLPNRRRMTELLEESLIAAEHRSRPCAVMLIDLDRFKQVNDTLGHPAGDALLKQVAERLARLIGSVEHVFRLGGDEFQIIIHDFENREALGELASRIITRLSEPYFVEDNRCIIGASIGIAVGLEDGRTRDELIRNADLALYHSKANGRGCFRFFFSHLLRNAEDKRTLEEDLRDSMEKGELSLAYQPVVETRTSWMTGVEALLRWHHPRRGPVSPDLFVPIAEEAGLIHRLGEWSLRKACEDAVSWPGNIRVAVNVSPLQFNDKAFPAVVRAALDASGLQPDRLELEITEGVFLQGDKNTDKMFAALKDIGVRLALDDFGTGYASLGYLRKAPFDKIKIDQSFVREATLSGSRNSAIIAAIVALAEAVGMETTAEGVEYMDQLELIRKLRISHVQGWIYSKAIASEELVQKLSDGVWTIEPSGPARQRSERQAMYRTVGLAHGHRYENAVIRNLSDSGALIEGVGGLARGTLILVDFGNGRLTLARVSRSLGNQVGIAFEEFLETDGNGGLRPRQRISPLLLSKAGLPSSDIVSDRGATILPLEEIAARIGLFPAARPAEPEAQSDPAGSPGAAEPDDQASQPGNERGPVSPPDPRFLQDSRLSFDQALALVDAAQSSSNRQLRYIVPLLMLTGVRQGELLRGRWDQIDFNSGCWTLPSRSSGGRPLRLTSAAIKLLQALPRWENCRYLLPNPTTLKPYQSIVRSWEVVRRRAGFPDLEIGDLRYGDVAGADQQHRIVERVLQGNTPDEIVQAVPAEPVTSTPAE